MLGEADFCVQCVVVVPVKLRAVLDAANPEAVKPHQFYSSVWALLTRVIAVPGMTDIA